MQLTTKQHALVSTQYSHVCYVSRKTHTRQCYFTVFTAFRCDCHSSFNFAVSLMDEQSCANENRSVVTQVRKSVGHIFYSRPRRSFSTNSETTSGVTISVDVTASSSRSAAVKACRLTLAALPGNSFIHSFIITPQG